MSFLLFVVGEVIGAVAGNSWSLLGDAAAMSVDVVSYFTNMVAEKIKSSRGIGGGDLSVTTQMLLEVVIPLFSVILLIGVTIYVTIGSLGDIITKPADDDVDITMLWLFSSLNAVVDIVSVYMFYQRGNDVFYEEPLDAMDPNSRHAMVDLEVEDGASSAVAANGSGSGGNDAAVNNNININSNTSNNPIGMQRERQARNQEAPKTNLNMISALTHVGGDSLRTISVFVAAAVATATSIPGYLCDAWAAVFVSVTIVIMVVPLTKEIALAYCRIKAKMPQQE
jgi:Co/Zn/Cd efflux system component